MDQDHDGVLSERELTAMLDKIGFYMTGNRKRDVQVLFYEADADQSGGITWREFIKAMENPTTKWGSEKYTFKYFITKWVLNFHSNPANMEKIYESNKSDKWYWPPRLFMIVISIIQVAVYLHYANEDCDLKPTLECPLSHSSPLAYRMCCRDEVWRWFTYSLVHVGWNHLIFNVIIQLIFGLFLEIVNGSLRVGLVYVCGILAGSLASSVSEPSANVVGASGAVYCLIGAWYAYVAINWDTLDKTRKYVGSIFLLILTCADFGSAIHLKYVEKSDASTSVAGHLGGLLMGATLGTYILKNEKISAYERYIKWAGITLGITGVVFAMFVNIFNDPDIKGLCPKLAKCTTY